MNPEEQADIRRTIERLYDEKDELGRHIAELEAKNARVADFSAAKGKLLDKAQRRIYELEAERDKLRAELQQTCSAAYDETARLRAERDKLRERDCCRLPDGRPV